MTGSAQCYLGPYWSAKLDRSVLRAMQLSARTGSLRVRVDETRVHVAGRALTVLKGEVTGKAAQRLVARA